MRGKILPAFREILRFSKTIFWVTWMSEVSRGFWSHFQRISELTIWQQWPWWCPQLVAEGITWSEWCFSTEQNREPDASEPTLCYKASINNPTRRTKSSWKRLVSSKIFRSSFISFWHSEIFFHFRSLLVNLGDSRTSLHIANLHPQVFRLDK